MPKGDNTTISSTGPPKVIMADIVPTGGTMPQENIYLIAHLDPETDPVVRAICERLFIDWQALMDE